MGVHSKASCAMVHVAAVTSGPWGRRDRVDGEAEIHHATWGASSCILTSQVAALLEAHVRLGGRAEQDSSTHVFPAGLQRRRPIPTGQRRTGKPSKATHLVSSRNYPAAELDRLQTHDDLGEARGAGRSRPRETACVRAASAGRLSCRWWKRPSGSMRARATDGPEPSRWPRRRAWWVTARLCRRGLGPTSGE